VTLSLEDLLLELAGEVAARGDLECGPVSRLREYDARNGTELVATLQAWLETFGDVATASRAVFVHPNTFRYRLTRIAQVGGIDLADADQRFAAMLHLRVWAAVTRGAAVSLGTAASAG
jgi:DNA-binding PucR family transcriptional regulator